jgi:hypothetical protein
MQDHIRAGENRHHCHERDESHDLFANVPQAQSERHDDQRELTDLGNCQPGQETRTAPVPHNRHNQNDAQRVADKDEQREPDGGGYLGPHSRPIHAGAQIDKEEQQQKVSQARQPGSDGIAVLAGRQRHPGQERPDLLGESEHLTDRPEEHRPRHGKQHQGILGVGQPAQNTGQDIPHKDPDRSQQSETPERSDQHRFQSGRIVSRPRRNRRTSSTGPSREWLRCSGRPTTRRRSVREENRSPACPTGA